MKNKETLCKQCSKRVRSSLWEKDKLCAACRTINGGYYRLKHHKKLVRDYTKHIKHKQAKEIKKFIYD